MEMCGKTGKKTGKKREKSPKKTEKKQNKTKNKNRNKQKKEPKKTRTKITKKLYLVSRMTSWHSIHLHWWSLSTAWTLMLFLAYPKCYKKNKLKRDKKGIPKVFWRIFAWKEHKWKDRKRTRENTEIYKIKKVQIANASQGLWRELKKKKREQN